METRKNSKKFRRLTSVFLTRKNATCMISTEKMALRREVLMLVVWTTFSEDSSACVVEEDSSPQVPRRASL